MAAAAKKLLLALFVFAFLAGSFLKSASSVSAQVTCPEQGFPLEQCTAELRSACRIAGSSVCPDDEAAVGGATINVQDVQAAINSPTPNLANTTAYIFYTISVLINGTFDPGIEAGPQASTGKSYHASYPDTLNQAITERGMIGGVSYLMAEMIRNQPASAGTYVAHVARNSKFAPAAYAQGIGFGALNPILGTWEAFRNVAYYLLILMFFITGFLILIRHKVSGNVAVTVQNALPRLVITLVLITFSYAIAGLIVDLMFLSIYFVINLFQGSIFTNETFDFAFGTQPKSLADIALNTHIFEFTIGYVFNTGNASAWGAASSVGEIIYKALNSIQIFRTIVGEGTIFGSLFEGILKLIFTIIFGIALLIAMFRTFFALLMSYAGFVINVVMSPFILLGGAIPGQNPFTGWVKNLIAGLAPFVVAIFMIFMALALTGSNTQPGIGYDPDATVQTGLRLPLIMSGDINANAFVGILAMGFMLLLPEAVNITKKLVGAKGGPFDEFQDKATSAFQKGWKGNQFVPGGKQLATGAVVGAGGAIAGGAAGGYELARSRGAGRLASLGAGAVGGAIGLKAAPAAAGLGVAVSAGQHYVEQGGKVLDTLRKSKNPVVQTGLDYVGSKVNAPREQATGNRIGATPSNPPDTTPRPTTPSGTPTGIPEAGTRGGL